MCVCVCVCVSLKLVLYTFFFFIMFDFWLRTNNNTKCHAIDRNHRYSTRPIYYHDVLCIHRTHHCGHISLPLDPSVLQPHAWGSLADDGRTTKYVPTMHGHQPHRHLHIQEKRDPTLNSHFFPAKQTLLAGAIA